MINSNIGKANTRTEGKHQNRTGQDRVGTEQNRTGGQDRTESGQSRDRVGTESGQNRVGTEQGRDRTGSGQNRVGTEQSRDRTESGQCDNTVLLNRNKFKGRVGIPTKVRIGLKYWNSTKLPNGRNLFRCLKSSIPL